MYLNNQLLFRWELDVRDNYWYLDESYGGNSIKGYLLFSPGFETIPAELDLMQATLVCGGKTYSLEETVATW